MIKVPATVCTVKIPTKLIAIKISIYSNQRYIRAFHICTWKQNRKKTKPKTCSSLHVSFTILLTLFLPAGTALTKDWHRQQGLLFSAYINMGYINRGFCFRPTSTGVTSTEAFAFSLHFVRNGPISLCSPLQNTCIVVFSVCWHTTLQQHCLFFIASRPLGSSPRLTSDLCLFLGVWKIFHRGLHSSFQPFSRWGRQLAAATVSRSKCHSVAWRHLKTVMSSLCHDTSQQDQHTDRHSALFNWILLCVFVIKP